MSMPRSAGPPRSTMTHPIGVSLVGVRKPVAVALPLRVELLAEDSDAQRGIAALHAELFGPHGRVQFVQLRLVSLRRGAERPERDGRNGHSAKFTEKLAEMSRRDVR
jgi:hypothetical protein